MKTFVVASCCILLLAGCIPILIGTAGVVTGYALSSDSASGDIKTSYRNLWDVSLSQLHKLNAEIVQSDESQGTMKVRISDYAVTLKIRTITSDSQHLKVAARRLLLPKPQFAQKIFFTIVEAL